jgi:hypothetical protein
MNLIRNIGIGSDATHTIKSTAENEWFEQFPTYEIGFPLITNNEISVDWGYDQVYARRGIIPEMHRKTSLWEALKRLVLLLMDPRKIRKKVRRKLMRVATGENN